MDVTWLGPTTLLSKPHSFRLLLSQLLLAHFQINLLSFPGQCKWLCFCYSFVFMLCFTIFFFFISRRIFYWKWKPLTMKLNDKLNQSSNEIKCHTHRTGRADESVWRVCGPFATILRIASTSFASNFPRFSPRICVYECMYVVEQSKQTSNQNNAIIYFQWTLTPLSLRIAGRHAELAKGCGASDPDFHSIHSSSLNPWLSLIT